MEKEFARGVGSYGCLSADAKGSARKSIAMLLSLLLVLQIMLVALQAFAPQTAHAASLPSNLVYKFAYGVRSDGLAYFCNDVLADGAKYTGKVVVNASGKVVFKEVWKSKQYSYVDSDGKSHSYTNKEPYLTISNDMLYEAGCYGGNLLIGKYSEPTYRPDKYGLFNPKTGKYVLQPTKTLEEVKAYCKKRGWKTEATGAYSTQKQKLPNGMTVEWKPTADRGLCWVNAKGSTPKVLGYDLPSVPSSVLFRKGVAGGNMYYVCNAKGKIGAINDKGKILIPFEYDSYADINQGSSYILLKKGGSWKYFDLNTIGKSSTSSAVQKAGWQKSSKGWWYRYSNGSYAKGLKKIGKSTYYFDKNGWMKTGWQKISGSWYYFASSGAMKTGWAKVGKSWYYMAKTGKMLTGWQTISGKKYYLGSNGAMRTGWQKINKAWYYFNGSGAMVANKWVGNYWLESNGKMATSKWVDNGKYYVGSNGIWVRGKTKSSSSSSGGHVHKWRTVTVRGEKFIECDCGAYKTSFLG